MAGVTKIANYDMTIRVVDLLTRFATKYQILADLIGVARPVEKEPGTEIKSVNATCSLESGIVAEGATIPKSVVTVTERTYEKMQLEKFAKAISMELIEKFGADAAVEKSDEAFITKLLNRIVTKFTTFIKTGTLTNVQTSFQSALASAKGLVTEKFQANDLTMTEVIGFVNTLDAYDYLGTASISIQNQFGIEYIKDFMGYRTVFLMPSNIIARNNVIALPVENVIANYIRPDNKAFKAAGLDFTVDESPDGLPCLGLHTNGNYDNFTGEMQAALGLVLFAEYLDGIAQVKIEASGSLGSITVASVAGTETGDSKVTVTYTPGVGEVLYYKEGSAALTPTYKDAIDLTGWTVFVPEEGGNQMSGLTASNVLTVVSVNGSGQAVASGNVTIVVK